MVLFCRLKWADEPVTLCACRDFLGSRKQDIHSLHALFRRHKWADKVVTLCACGDRLR